jgi:hypothetical protein
MRSSTSAFTTRFRMVSKSWPLVLRGFEWNGKKIETILSQVLLRDYEMSDALYEHELLEVLEALTGSMKTDKDNYIFTLTENQDDVAMLLIEKSGKIYIDEKARERLKVPWTEA